MKNTTLESIINLSPDAKRLFAEILLGEAEIGPWEQGNMEELLAADLVHIATDEDGNCTVEIHRQGIKIK